ALGMSATEFEYRAVSATGKEARGMTRAQNRGAAYRQIVGMGLTPTVIRPAREARSRRTARVSPRAIAQFTSQLECFIGARIPLGEAVAAIADQEENRRFREIIMNVAGSVQSGNQLSAALSAHRGAFGEVYEESVRAAEHSGNMTRVLSHLADMLERADETRRQVRGALLYPAIVVGALTLAVAFLLTFVVPRFAHMFSTRGVELPALTRALVVMGESAKSRWWAWLGAIFGTALGMR